MARGQMRASTPMAILATTAIGALMYLIVVMFVPFVGGSVETSMPGIPCKACDGYVLEAWNGSTTCSDGLVGPGNETFSYNSTCNPNALTSASSIWTTISGFLQIAAIFAVMALVFMFLRGMI